MTAGAVDQSRADLANAWYKLFFLSALLEWEFMSSTNEQMKNMLETKIPKLKLIFVP